MGLIGGVYQLWWLSSLPFDGSAVFTGPPWRDGLFQAIFYSFVTFALTAVPVFSVCGAIVLLTLAMSEERRGILAFFVMIGSIIPTVFLALNVLNFFIVPSGSSWNWPIVVVAVIWIGLLWIAVKVLRAPRICHA